MSDEFEKTDATLEEAKQWLRDRFERGAPCPCCTQFVKLYKRAFNSSMAYVLLIVYRHFRSNPIEWLHVPSYIAKTASGNPRLAAAVRGDWAKMKLWGLIEEKPGTREDGSPRVGYYRITEIGRRFARNETRIPSHVYIYNGEALGRLVTDDISIVDAISHEFDYNELMTAT
jgi:hypothetical protein